MFASVCLHFLCFNLNKNLFLLAFLLSPPPLVLDLAPRRRRTPPTAAAAAGRLWSEYDKCRRPFLKTFFKLKVFLFLFSVRGTRCRLVGGRLLTDTFLSRKNSKCESGKESTAARYFSLIAVAAAVSPQNMKRRQRLFLKKRYWAFHFWSQTAAAALSVERDCKNNFSLVSLRFTN